MADMASAVAGALARARTPYEQAYLRQVGTILRRDVTQGESASSGTEYKALPEKIKCREIRGSDGVEIEVGAQIVSTRGVEIRFPWGSDIRDTDRVQIGTEIFAVISTDKTRADALYLSATCVKVPDNQ